MIFRLRIWVATLALALGAPVAARAQAPETVRVAVEWSLQSLHAFLHLADARGEFARRGVVVPIARGFGTLDTVNRVARGETDIGFGDLNVALTYNLTADPARRVVIVGGGRLGAAIAARLPPGWSVVVVDAAAGEHISSGCEAGGHGAARHQHLHAIRAIAQQQNCGRRPGRGGRALGVYELGGSDHGAL